MILNFYGWSSHFNRNDKLEALRSAIEDLDKSVRIISQRHDRLLKHLGLYESNDGPTIKKLPNLPETGVSVV